MQVYLNDMLYALSYALDYVEAEFVGVKSYHSARVAYLCVRVGETYGMSPEALLKLAAAAVIHDSALTEYKGASKTSGVRPEVRDSSPNFLRGHCEPGERNASILPFYEDIRGAVLYHHERADGTGAFRKKADDTPLLAQLIHLGDQLDNQFPLDFVDETKYARMSAYLERESGRLFSPELVQRFKEMFPVPMGAELEGEQAGDVLRSALPQLPLEYDAAQIQALAAVFARIIDYKSHVTCMHSRGIAEKSGQLGAFLGMETEKCTKLYLAGALHDIGKMAIPTEILEKPDKLTKDEFEVMKTHAKISWDILQKMNGLEDVAEWAAFHHEKLNGAGYPFGYTAERLSREDRILACMDIYQALTESRLYKKGFSHEKSIGIMREMVAGGFIDADITAAIDECFCVGAQH